MFLSMVACGHCTGRAAQTSHQSCRVAGQLPTRMTHYCNSGASSQMQLLCAVAVVLGCKCDDRLQHPATNTTMP